MRVILSLLAIASTVYLGRYAIDHHVDGVALGTLYTMLGGIAVYWLREKNGR